MVSAQLSTVLFRLTTDRGPPLTPIQLLTTSMHVCTSYLNLLLEKTYHYNHLYNIKLFEGHVMSVRLFTFCYVMLYVEDIKKML